ncbi:MAG TPA: cupin domain-containing protein [Streptosporangiaceae bacterium]|nr:cupin domain-containing protein [Streptosporangiaceae bacterium]
MRVITETTERTIETPTAVMAGLAAPSQGTAELCTWRVRMTSGRDSPVHVIDREQVWMPLRGAFEFTVDGETAVVGTGEALAVPSGATRQFRVSGGTSEAEAIVCMAAGGQAAVLGSDAWQSLPWAL